MGYAGLIINLAVDAWSTWGMFSCASLVAYPVFIRLSVVLSKASCELLVVNP